MESAVVAGTWSDWILSGEWAEEGEAGIPMLPANVQEFVQVASDPDAHPRRLVAAVVGDPVLAAQVIRMANSAFSAPATRITRLDEAVIRLGTQTVRNVVIAGCLGAQMVDPQIYGPRGRAVVDHCVCTAFLAARLTRLHHGHADLFLGGLLHDIGKLLILKLAHDYRRRMRTGPGDEELDAIMSSRHAAMGGWLAGEWKMPSSLSDPIVWHHEPAWAEDEQATGIVYTANRLAHRYGFGCDADSSDLLADPVVSAIELTAERLAHLDANATELRTQARQMTSI